MTVRDDEMREWMDAWQGGDGPPAPAAREAILRRVKRRTLGLRVLVAAEVILVLAALALLGWLARTSPHPVDAAVAAALGLLGVVVLAFSLWNRRGVWRTRARTTSALLDFNLLRARRRRRGLRAGWVLLALEVLLLAPWIRLHVQEASAGAPETGDLVRGYLLLTLFVGIAAAILVALGRWTRREIARLEELRRELS